MTILVIDRKGNIFYEAVSLEDAQNNCPHGYQIVYKSL